ncbi:MAG TPA: glycosyltransferase family 4 protein [Bacteroidia bacterium]|jgi:glycosyltransferase involved in cell wall biosynthesis|nr:glycosyltransferase family 4 protein [Bacteroidia bacterium]
MKKILFIASHRLNRSPSQRFRFEQYIPFLQKNDYSCRLSPMVTEADDMVMYAEEKYFQKFLVILKSFVRRLRILRLAPRFDIVFVQREAFLLGSTFFERRFKRSGAKFVFDFDDAIWLMNVSDVNKRFSWIKRPSKTAEIIAISDVVIAGNNYLAEYARSYNPNVCIIPTTVDTDKFQPKYDPIIKNRICIGWTGSHTTIKHFTLAIPVLKEIKKKYGDKVYFKVIGDSSYSYPELNIHGTKWSQETEVEDLLEIDIGLMPLPDDIWSKGKCGLKSLEYMALCIPPVISPVGVNTDIVEDGVNGFLANTNSEWVDKLSLLIESAELRKKIGIKGRETVVAKYSVISQSNNYLKLFNDLLEKQGK